ncbi:MAG: hypothetical protein OXH42_12950 [Acidimicrobiaceae bacterium]|nr:hypothetical protein [Acidimicrobiaceae bacterium]
MRPSYPSYRDSGISWLGELPTHWDAVRLKFMATYRTSSVDKKSNADEIPVRLCNYTDVYYGERIRAEDGKFMVATATAHEVERFGLRVGDVLITKDSEDWQDIGVPALVEDSAEDFVCGYHLGIVRAGEAVDPGYLFRALQSDGVNKQLQVAATGVTRYGISNRAVEEAVIPMPPLAEQRAITMFLAHATGRIDELVERTGFKDRGSLVAGAVGSLIERLREYRSALITAAVTGKIDVRGADSVDAAATDASSVGSEAAT